MRRRSALAVCLASIAAIALTIVINLATTSVSQHFRPPLWSILTALAVIGLLAVLAQIRVSRRDNETINYERPDHVNLSSAITVLARAIRAQWRAEATIRSLNQPQPIKIRLSTTNRPIAADPIAVLGSGDTAGRILRLHLRSDVTQVVDMFWRLPNRQLVVLGAPGAGKSVLALLFTLQMLETRTEDAPVPLLLSFS